MKRAQLYAAHGTGNGWDGFNIWGGGRGDNGYGDGDGDGYGGDGDVYSDGRGGNGYGDGASYDNGNGESRSCPNWEWALAVAEEDEAR